MAALPGPATPGGPRSRGSVAAVATPLRYTTGSAHSPGDPFGLTDLTIGDGGAATLDVHHRGTVRSWSGTVGPATVERIQAHLAEAGFPAVEPHPLPAGSSLRTLQRGDGDHAEVARIAFHAARKMAGYGEAFALLDALVVALTGGEVPVIPNPPAVEVSGAHRTGSDVGAGAGAGDGSASEG